MRRRDTGPVVTPWPPHLAVFDPAAWAWPGDADAHPRRARMHAWFQWVGARMDWLTAQGMSQGAAGDLAFDTDVRPDRL